MPIPRASMGFVGSVTLGNVAVSLGGPTSINGLNSFNGNVTVRATSANVRASQDISHPDVVDGRMDRTVYQLGARIVEGTIDFPLIHEGSNVSFKDCGTTINFGQLLWALAAQRDQFGRLVNDSMDVRIRYTDDTAFSYPSSLINTLSFNVQAEQEVSMSMGIIGGANATDDVRIPLTDTGRDIDFLSPARIVTWNDFILKLYGDENVIISGDWIRNFQVTINNNAERYYTLNNRLAPQDITAKKRVIEGSVQLMGRNRNLSELAYNNQSRFTSSAKIAFGYSIGATGTPVFTSALNGVVFEIEEIGITNDLVETNVAFYAHGDCETNFEAAEIGDSGVGLPNGLPAAGDFGGPTSPFFPNFRPQ